MKIYEIDKMAFEYIEKSLKRSFITTALQNEILDNLENNIELSEEAMSYLLTAITFNKELVDSYRKYLIELLENPTEGAYAWKHTKSYNGEVNDPLSNLKKQSIL